MAWTTPRTWVTGETVTAAHMNANVRDNLVAVVPTNQTTVATWTPAYDGGGAFDIGNAVVTARYWQVGSIVFVYYSMDMGTTTVMGTRFSLTMPFTSNTPANDLELNNIGMGVAVDSSTGSQWLLAVRDRSSTQFRLSVATNMAAVTTTVPFTWTTDDRLQFTATYTVA